jgi:hypothetical protein
MGYREIGATRSYACPLVWLPGRESHDRPMINAVVVLFLHLIPTAVPLALAKQYKGLSSELVSVCGYLSQGRRC